MVNPLQLTSMLVDWMDPEKTVYGPFSHTFEYLLTISTTEKCGAARRMTVSTSILPRTSSKPYLMTTLHVRKITLSPRRFYP